MDIRKIRNWKSNEKWSNLSQYMKIECEVCHSAFKMETISEEKRMPRLI
jgi:hypothetical protein